MKLILSKEYLELINNAKKRNPNEIIYGENHHIYMKSLSGENSETVRLTYEEHYLAHKYLALANPDIKQCQSAWWNMCQCTKDGRVIASEEDYAEARKRESKISSDRAKKQWENLDFRNKMSGDNCSSKRKDVREKLSKSLKGRKRPDGSGRKPINIICLEHLEWGIFNSYSDAYRYCSNINIKGTTESHLSEHVNHPDKRKYCGKDNEGLELHWIKCFY